jgi:hypothetical protein
MSAGGGELMPARVFRYLLIGAASLAWLLPNSLFGWSISDLIIRDGSRFSDLFVSCGAPGTELLQVVTVDPRA